MSIVCLMDVIGYPNISISRIVFALISTFLVSIGCFVIFDAIKYREQFFEPGAAVDCVEI